VKFVRDLGDDEDSHLERSPVITRSEHARPGVEPPLCITTTSHWHQNTWQTVHPVSAASSRYRLRCWWGLRSARTRTRFGERGFFYSGPATWNTLPSDIHDITDTSIQKATQKCTFWSCFWSCRIAAP